MLTVRDAKRFYDRFGARQDKQDFYEAPAIADLLEHGDFTHAGTVFDLLSPAEVKRMLGEAHRVLEPAALLCLAGVTTGTTIRSRVVMGLWNNLFRIAPPWSAGAARCA